MKTSFATYYFMTLVINRKCATCLPPKERAGSAQLLRLWRTSHNARDMLGSTRYTIGWRDTNKVTWLEHNRLPCRQVCKVFSWLVINAGEPSSLWAVPPLHRGSWVFIKKTNKHGKAMEKKPVSRTPPWFVLQFLPPGVSALVSLIDEPWLGHISRRIPYLPTWSLVRVFTIAMESKLRP